MGNPSFSLVRMVINLHTFLYISECHLSPNISPLLYLEKRTWNVFLVAMFPANRPHVQPPLQLGTTILLMRLSRHWEPLQKLLNLTAWTTVINGYPHCGGTLLLKKWNSNSSRLSKLWIPHSPSHLCYPHFHSFPFWISTLSLCLLSGSPTRPQLTSTHPWNPEKAACVLYEDLYILPL